MASYTTDLSNEQFISRSKFLDYVTASGYSDDARALYKVKRGEASMAKARGFLAHDSNYTYSNFLDEVRGIVGDDVVDDQGKLIENVARYTPVLEAVLAAVTSRRGRISWLALKEFLTSIYIKKDNEGNVIDVLCFLYMRKSSATVQKIGKDAISTSLITLELYRDYMDAEHATIILVSREELAPDSMKSALRDVRLGGDRGRGGVEITHPWEWISELDLAINPIEHICTPRHVLLPRRDQDDVTRSHGIKPTGLNGILSSDIIQRYYNWSSGSVIMVFRDVSFMPVAVPYSVNYRVVIDDRTSPPLRGNQWDE